MFPESKRILYVEDDEFQRARFKEALNCFGFIVVEASYVTEACEVLVEQTFDAIVLDNSLPESPGSEKQPNAGMKIAEFIRCGCDRNAEAPILFLSQDVETLYRSHERAILHCGIINPRLTAIEEQAEKVKDAVYSERLKEESMREIIRWCQENRLIRDIHEYRYDIVASLLPLHIDFQAPVVIEKGLPSGSSFSDDFSKALGLKENLKQRLGYALCQNLKTQLDTIDNFFGEAAVSLQICRYMDQGNIIQAVELRSEFSDEFRDLCSALEQLINTVEMIVVGKENSTC